ncbi:NAD(P)H-binding protein [Flavobacterium azooxidireducens]|uniref:NAD(P)H-binding protein n=1 Tax=Flavobacterium azooxidireducens TaxID=1871076 RepID=A0ABY4KHV2_9FLAO|nr:NAD(P)H-binding protein [Flavobacterium azooxidireducens]UPQ80405.1 NAD(P)H-binding protein [Flavobacterium azooxidireducens]
MKQISILGCGWLGMPLAKHLIQNGYSIKGSTTTETKLELLQNEGISPFLISLKANDIPREIADFLENSEILIINIPPGLRGNSGENFVAKMENFIPFIVKSSVKKVIFVSSTSVYADKNELITEETPPKPETESGKQLLISENLLLNNSNFQTTILRFGGLIGEDRHPIKFLSGRNNIENPEAPINLIHQLDCIEIIQKIIEKEVWNTVFNAVAPFHPNRKKYYTEKALELNLVPPQFNENQPSVGKTVSSNKLITVLNYEFKNLG